MKKLLSKISVTMLALTLCITPIQTKATNLELETVEETIETQMVEDDLNLEVVEEDTEDENDLKTETLADETSVELEVSEKRTVETATNAHLGDDLLEIDLETFLQMRDNGEIPQEYSTTKQTVTQVSNKVSIVETNFKWNEELVLTNKPEKIILHHIEASRPGQTIPVTDIHQWHKNNGWAGIGYHFYITKNGTIYRGRPENAIGAHASENNINTLGIAVEGTYMTEQMPAAQKQAVIELSKYLKQVYKIGTVLGHKEVNSTNCPGKNYPLNEIRNEIMSFQPASDVQYRTHVQDYGWQSWTADGSTNGTTGKSKRLEGIEIKVNSLPAGGRIKYRTHVQDYGWQPWVYDGAMSGTSGQSKRLEGIEIQLEGVSSEYRIEYRVHIQDIGWQEWKSNGELAGTVGQSKRLEAIEIRFVKERIPDVSYRTHVQNEGWQKWKANGVTSGTTGESKRLEGISIKLEQPQGMNIVYRTHIQDVGWQSWKRNGEESGTSGQSKRLEAIEIKLENAPPGYHVEYRVHVQDYGWQPWKRDGQLAGTEGQFKRLEGIEIKIVKD